MIKGPPLCFAFVLLALPPSHLFLLGICYIPLNFGMLRSPIKHNVARTNSRRWIEAKTIYERLEKERPIAIINPNPLAIHVTGAAKR